MLNFPKSDNVTTKTERQIINENRVRSVQRVGGPLLVVGVGFVGSMYMNMKKEGVTMRQVGVDGFTFAVKALALGTALSFGTFVTLTAIFVTATGVTTIPEFGDYMDRAFQTPETLAQRKQARIEENERYESILAGGGSNAGMFDVLKKTFEGDEGDSLPTRSNNSLFYGASNVEDIGACNVFDED